VKVVRSIFALPTTAMRGRFAIGIFWSEKNAEFSQARAVVSIRGLGD